MLPRFTIPFVDSLLPRVASSSRQYSSVPQLQLAEFPAFRKSFPTSEQEAADEVTDFASSHFASTVNIFKLASAGVAIIVPLSIYFLYIDAEHTHNETRKVPNHDIFHKPFPWGDGSKTLIDTSDQHH